MVEGSLENLAQGCGIAVLRPRVDRDSRKVAFLVHLSANRSPLTSTPWLQKHKSRSGDDDGFKITLALLGVECDGNPKKTRFHQVIRGLLAFQRKQNGNNGSIAETLAGPAGTR